MKFATVLALAATASAQFAAVNEDSALVARHAGPKPAAMPVVAAVVPRWQRRQLARAYARRQSLTAPVKRQVTNTVGTDGTDGSAGIAGVSSSASIGGDPVSQTSDTFGGSPGTDSTTLQPSTPQPDPALVDPVPYPATQTPVPQDWSPATEDPFADPATDPATDPDVVPTADPDSVDVDEDDDRRLKKRHGPDDDDDQVAIPLVGAALGAGAVVDAAPLLNVGAGLGLGVGILKRHGPDGDDDDEVPIFGAGLDADALVAVDPLLDVGAGLGVGVGLLKRQDVSVITTTTGSIGITSSGSYKQGEPGDNSSPSGDSGSSPSPASNPPPPQQQQGPPPEPEEDEPEPQPQTNVNQPNNGPPPPPPQQNNNNGPDRDYGGRPRGGGGGGRGWGRGGQGPRPGNWGPPRGYAPPPPPQYAPRPEGGLSLNLGIGGRGGLLGTGLLAGGGGGGLLGGILKRQTLDFAALQAAANALGIQPGAEIPETAKPGDFALSTDGTEAAHSMGEATSPMLVRSAKFAHLRN